MDAKITKKRLGHQLSYDWIKIAGTCILAVVLLLVLFTTIATRPTAGQTFDFYTFYNVFFHSDELGTLDDLKRGGALSFDIQQLNTYEVTSTGYEEMVLSTRFAAGEGDVLVAADVGDVYAEDGSGALTDLSGLKEFLYTYRGNCMWLGTDGQPLNDPQYGAVGSNYFADCAAYLDKYFPGAGYHDAVTAGQYTALDTSATLDTETGVVEADFRERMRGDKRYKTEEQIKEGIKDEYDRLENLRDAFVRVWNSVKTDGAIRVNEMTFSVDTNGDGTAETYNWSYSFDISGLENIHNLLYYGADGSRAGLNLCVVRNGSSSEEELRYEPFTLLSYFVNEYNGGDWATYHEPSDEEGV